MNDLSPQEPNHSSRYYKKKNRDSRKIEFEERKRRGIEEEEEEEMKAVRSYPRPEPRRVGNGLIITFMVLSLCILSLIRARYISTPFGKAQDLSDRSRRHVSRGEEDEGNRVLLEELREAKRPICVETSRRSEVCEASGDVRVHGSSQTIFVDRDLTSQEWKTKPYARKHDKGALANVKEWTIKAVPDEAPQCTDNHAVPAVIFSVGGYTGNLFHDFTDVLVPLFLTTRHFRGEVQFVVTDAKAWWLIKFSQVLRQLSNYEVIDADADSDAVRCFPRVVAGLTFHKELGIDPAKSPNSYAMADFKVMLREAYGLERSAAEPAGDKWDVRRKPRLLIISRKGSRVFLNERGMSDMAMSLGFDVRVADPDVTTDIGKFARLVNSADVLIGVHGSGLTNVVFLPRGAVFIQVVPMGNLEWLARDTFENPSPEMELKYLAYRIQADESTLSDQYPKDHPVFTDPQSIHKKGWGELSRIYLVNQNLKPHLGRLRLTLLDALKLLPHGHAMAQQ